MQEDVRWIKNLADQISQTLNREESITKYKIILAEIAEMNIHIVNLKQHANIEIHFKENE